MKIFNTAPNGYRFNKLIFYSPIVIGILILMHIAYVFDFDFSPRYYINCSSEFCENPFFSDKRCDMDWCRSQMLRAGEYGEQAPGGLFKYFSWLMIALCALSFLLNHLFHNRGVPFQFPEPMHTYLNLLGDNVR